MATKKNTKNNTTKKTTKKVKKNVKKTLETKVYQVDDVINEPLPFSNVSNEEPIKIEENISNVETTPVAEPTPTTTPDIYEKLPEEDNNATYSNNVVPKANGSKDILFIIGGIIILLGLLALLAV
jgi:hypothetical protein